MDQHVSCLIICRADVDPALEEYDGDTCIISTPFAAGRACRLIYQAIPISRPCQRGEIVCFHLDDYIDDVREVVLKSRYRSYPVLDENEKVVGTLSRYHLLRPRRKQVVLVDHNEFAQSVPGLDQAEILEIVDHHRLADIQTKNPVSEDFDMDAFTDTMEQKDALLEQLKELDEGFERTYEGVQQELNMHREQYADAIQRMKELIRRVTALGVELQTLEERNRAKLEIKFSKQQRELRQIKTSNKVATTYYKNMSNAPASDPYFMDQKK